MATPTRPCSPVLSEWSIEVQPDTMRRSGHVRNENACRVMAEEGVDLISIQHPASQDALLQERRKAFVKLEGFNRPLIEGGVVLDLPGTQGADLFQESR